MAQLASGVAAGDRRVLARTITLAESSRADHRAAAEAVLEELARRAGPQDNDLQDNDPQNNEASAGAAPESDGRHSLRIGISGPPGVGKSTFIEAFGLHLVEAGHRMAVLAVDPSSNVSGGSILGDKTRMPGLSRHDGAFVRPSPGGGELGGVARRTRDAISLCEAAGFDTVVVETIGVGQSEVAVASMVDVFVLLVNPGGGDELQGIKRGIMELADVVVVTKADGDLAPAAGRAAADYRNALGLLRPRWASWRPKVVACSSVTGEGIDDVAACLDEFAATVDASGELVTQRRRQATEALWAELRSGLVDRLAADPAVRARIAELEPQVADGAVPPTAAARRILDAWGDHNSSGADGS